MLPMGHDRRVEWLQEVRALKKSSRAEAARGPKQLYLYALTSLAAVWRLPNGSCVCVCVLGVVLGVLAAALDDTRPA